MSIKADTRHLYLRVIDEIKRDIENGTYSAKQKLPSEFQLAKKLGVSRATLREALRILEEDNIVTRRHGVGTFVNQKPIFSSGIEQLTSVTDMIEHFGKNPGSTYLSTELVKATEKEKLKFAPKEIDTLAKVERIRTANGQPVVYCVDKVPKGYIPLNVVQQEDSLFKLMEDHSKKRITYAVTYIEPISYEEDIFNILECDRNQSLLLLNQMHYTEDDEPVLYSSNYFRPDVFSFYVLRKRL